MVLVAPCETPKTTAGGIILPTDEADRQEFAQRRGRIVAMSPMAFTFKEWPAGMRTPQVGDLVLHVKYAGGDVVTGADKRDYRLMRDTEVQAVLERAAADPDAITSIPNAFPPVEVEKAA
jgi:co-chaperonin GroES (HSP10)